MIKLQDFAKECSVTDRQIQRLIKKYDSELTGHYERRGTNGTWIDETGQNILRSKMKRKEIVLVDKETTNRIKELEQKLERKEEYIKILELANANKQQQISSLEKEKLLIEEKTAEKITAAEDKLKNELQSQFNDQLLKLKEKHQEELNVEKHRKLTLKERLFGIKN